ncbi:hypothetical protein [Clostridium perfringens]|uniref:hypothetical protein n=1 Tax=Clostridium perfringens TaxID=1502 RepID=UPI002AC4C9EA|nr:hypothetical protein [Clostridium perfringens]MDZ5061948.1 hypothetical protein [Clostridium perfringens]
MKMKDMFENELYNKKEFTTKGNTKVYGLYLSSKNKKVTTLQNLINRYFGLEDVSEETAQFLYLILNKAYVEVNKKENMTEEEFCYLFLLHDDDSKDCIRSKQLFEYIKTVTKHYIYDYKKVEKREIGERLNGISFIIRNFSDFNFDEDDTVEDFIDSCQFNNNDVFTEEENISYTAKWIENNLNVLSKGQRDYLVDPLSVNPSARVKHQKALEKKFEKLALKEFGVNKSLVVNVQLEKDTIEKILNSDDLTEAIVSNLDYISGLNGYYDIQDVYLKEINLAYSKGVYPSNMALIKVCEVLHNRLDFLEEKLAEFKVDEEAIEDIKKKTRFDIKKIPNIDLQDNKKYPKRVRSGNTQTYKKFLQLHKDSFVDLINLPDRFYSWLEFNNWLEENSLCDDKTYYLTYINKEVFLLPDSIHKLFKGTNPSNVKEYDSYRGVVRFLGKSYYTSYTKDYQRCVEDIRELKTKILKENLELFRDKLTERTYLFLMEYKF